ncbi:DUF6873 domain-containing protein [Hathewaya histolytica]|uniref:DUF6873 domain-containing protein n=1 Tax=Hathewaya histolytica TaxID=1498 RepID=A0A4U9RLZ7_HATHI|nr:hypothetical protein [Hathewaya histolytica]VTQ92929.1 Uncharacterised protein [Hathewaya histolytica]
MNCVFVDNRIFPEELEKLETLNKNILKVPELDILYPSIKGHPDILINIIDNKSILVHKDIQMDFIQLLESKNLKVLYTENSLEATYPKDIIINALSTEEFFIHNLNFTDKTLLKKNMHKKLISVNQGYTKCSTALVNKNSIITSDVTIAKNLKENNFNVLLIPPGDIILEGLNYGFIGGTCGLVEDNVLAFYGDLNYYAYGREVLKFLKECKVEPLFLRKSKLIDRGSILSI